MEDGLVRGFVSDVLPLDATDALARLFFFVPKDETLEDVAVATDVRVPIDETFVLALPVDLTELPVAPMELVPRDLVMLVLVVVVLRTEPPASNGGRGDRDRELEALEDIVDVAPFSTFKYCPLVEIRVFDPLDFTTLSGAVFVTACFC